MKNLKILYICLFSLTLSSCAYYEKVFKKDSTEFEPKPEVSTNYIIEELWSIEAGGGRSPKSTVLQPSFDSKNNIYTIDSDGLINSIDSQTGDRNWSQNMNLDVTSGITSYKDLVFFGTTSTMLWKYVCK